MNLLNDILGGSLPGGVGDVLARFENQGRDPEVVSDAEAHQSYSQVATQLQPDQYRQAAEAAFARLTPEQRGQFVAELQNAGQQQGISLSAFPAGAGPTPAEAAAVATDLHVQQPNLLQQLLGGGGTFSSPVAKLALLGITVFAAQHLVPRR